MIPDKNSSLIQRLLFIYYAVFSIGVIGEIILYKHDGSPLIAAAAGKITERTDKIGKSNLSSCMHIRRIS